MKATGVVRRIDDLGRIVIPKEIRKNLITQKEVKGLFNCIACHTTADKGIYGERDIKIPNFGRWED